MTRFLIPLTPRRAAAAVWLVLGVSSGLGCIPIYTPRVQQDITTGDKLLALKMAETSKPPEELAALRADLLAHPPDMRAAIDDGYMPAQKAVRISSYSALNPGFYASLATERADLKRARDAGLLSDAEFAELDADLGRQAERSFVRRWFETASVAISGSIRQGYFASDDCIERTPANVRAWASQSWLDRALESGDAHSNPAQEIWMGYRRHPIGIDYLMDPSRAKPAP